MLRTGRSYAPGKTLSTWVFGRVAVWPSNSSPETRKRRGHIRTYVHIPCSNLIVRWGVVVTIVVSPALRSLRQDCQFKTSLSYMTSSFQKTKGVGKPVYTLTLREYIKNYTNSPRFIRNQDNGSVGNGFISCRVS